MVTIVVMDVNEMPTLEGEEEIDDYAENGTDPVATYTAADPEGAGIDWEVAGTDRADFTVDGGELRFKESPNYESATDRDHPDDDATTDVDESDAAMNNTYNIIVRATEMQAAGTEGEAESNELAVTVMVANVDEDGTITLSRRQPQVTAGGLTASVTDLDGATTGMVWQWSVPKVSRPDTEKDAHWEDAGGTSDGASYTPDASTEGSELRVKVTYLDPQSETEMKTEYALTEFAVRAAPDANDAPTFPADGDYELEVPENSDKGTLVGGPVEANDQNAGDRGKLSYVLSGTHDGVLRHRHSDGPDQR